MSLKTKTIRGAFWFALATVTNNLVSFLVTLVLARLLIPDDFGLMAIASFTVYAISIFQTMGLSQALIYKGDKIENFAPTAFVLSVGLGITAFLLILLLAPMVATIFKEPQAAPLARALAICLLISSFALVPEALLMARLDFMHKSIADILPSFGYALITVGLAILGGGVWSIILGRIVEAIVRVGLIWYLARWQLVLQFEQAKAKEILSYGKDVAVSSAMAILFLNIDNLFISRILDTSQLGYYTLAFSLATLPVLFAQRIVDTVSFPAYAQIKEQKDILSRAYLKSLRIVTFCVLPMNLGLFAVAPILVPRFYGEKWQPSVVLVQILSVYGFSRAVANVPTTVLLALGKQHLFPRFNLFYLTLAAVLLGLAIYAGGTIGAAIVMTLIICAAAATWLLIANHYLNISVKKLVQAILAQGLAAIVMFVTVQVSANFLYKSFFDLLFLIAIGVIIYLGTLLLITGGRVMADIREIINPLFHKSSTPL